MQNMNSVGKNISQNIACQKLVLPPRPCGGNTDFDTKISISPTTLWGKYRFLYYPPVGEIPIFILPPRPCGGNTDFDTKISISPTTLWVVGCGLWVVGCGLWVMGGCGGNTSIPTIAIFAESFRDYFLIKFQKSRMIPRK
jgi:hypothetical protein